MNLWSYPRAFFCTGPMGAIGTRLSLRPLIEEGGKFSANPGVTRRGNAKVCPGCKNSNRGVRRCRDTIHSRRPGQAKREPGPITTKVDVRDAGVAALSTKGGGGYGSPRSRGRQKWEKCYPSSTASAPFTASALSITVRSNAGACTEMFSAKKRASVT